MTEARAPRVEIALATYNGARFLPDQLASITAQDWPDLAIIAADDGSSDATAAILSEFDARPLHLITGTGGLGVRDNFATALAATTAGYVFLSDQDDHWEPDKVPVMMMRMLELERHYGPAHPLLVYCDLAIVDEQLHSQGTDWFTATSKTSGSLALADLVLTGHVPGCAMAMNRALLDVALPIPKQASIHDWWLALVAAARGTIAYVDRPLVRYRQHSNNTLGAAAALPGLGSKLAALLRRPGAEIRRLRTFYDLQARVADGNLAALRETFEHDLPQPSLDLLAIFEKGGWYRRQSLLMNARTGVSLPARLAIAARMGRTAQR